MKAVQNLGEVLDSVDDLTWDDALYLAGEYPWTADTLAVVLDPDEIENEAEPPSIVRQHGLRYVLDMQSVHAIVIHARQEMTTPDNAYLLRAFNYYWKHDAFMRDGRI